MGQVPLKRYWCALVPKRNTLSAVTSMEAYLLRRSFEMSSL